MADKNTRIVFLLDDLIKLENEIFGELEPPVKKQKTRSRSRSPSPSIISPSKISPNTMKAIMTLKGRELSSEKKKTRAMIAESTKKEKARIQRMSDRIRRMSDRMKSSRQRKK